MLMTNVIDDDPPDPDLQEEEVGQPSWDTNVERRYSPSRERRNVPP